MMKSIIGARWAVVGLLVLFLFSFVSASLVSVWQGQYYTGTNFNTGTYVFNFTVYDSSTGGDVCFSNITSLTTGNWGEWRTEQSPWSGCNNSSKEYFLNINIDGADQVPRRRLTVSDFLRRDVSDINQENITADYYFGDGSYLTGISGSGDINSVQGDGVYIYNGSDVGNVVLAFNETKLNLTIDSRAGGDNSSWNESYADGKYIASGDEDNLNVNSSIYSNSTIWWASVSSWASDWFYNDVGVLSFNKTKINFTITDIADNYNETNLINLVNSTANIQSLGFSNTTQLSATYLNLSGTNANQNINLGIFNLSAYTLTLNNTIYLRRLALDFPVNLTNYIPIYAKTNDQLYIKRSDGTERRLWDVGFGSVIIDENVTFTENINATGNSVFYNLNSTGLFYGNGSQLTDIQATEVVDDSITTSKIADNNITDAKIQSLNWSKLFDVPMELDDGDNDTQKNASGFYLYNDSTTIYFNETKLNLTIDARAGSDNSSWNESYASTLYYSISNPFSFYNSSNFVVSDYYLKSNPFGFWNESYATFNKSYADTLYAPISVTGDNSSWNESYAYTLYATINEPLWTSNFTVYNFSWSLDTQKNASGYLYNDSTTVYLNESLLNNTIDSRAGGDNSSWNESCANTIYLNLSGGNANQNMDISPYNFSASNFLGFLNASYIQNAPWVTSSSNWNITGSAYLYNNSGILSINETRLNNTISSRGIALGFNSTYNVTYNAKADYQFGANNFNGSGYFNTTGNIRSTNISVSSIILQQDPVNHKIYDNSSCVIIEGDTSTMYIC